MAARKKARAVTEEPVFTPMGERLLAKHIDAHTLAAELLKIEVLTAKAVVARARDPLSPLHPLFEWNDRIAGERHREDYARFVIACVHFRHTDTPEGTSTPRMLYNVKRDGRGQWLHINEVRGNLDYQSSLIGQALDQLRRMETSFSHVMDICEPVRRAREDIEARQREREEARRRKRGGEARPDA